MKGGAGLIVLNGEVGGGGRKDKGVEDDEEQPLK